ncbi:dTDP-4-dehydrorhamnose reductase [Arenibacter algicola]|uniref:dTDP-4-dehydrorhamnose reductase n=1 Tax=Arenibacter algicola TaxID=616991 RepID=A0A221UUL7_9FLAO|nr:dTDP-4-dehydrorhamnose reductase [Arenibacter algicola]ASO04888.1 dTDP-4-dehydrorhamnose reductase [Arenibacter algicola]|tara:strand:- start:40 stop:840 length:801 start_codon:yes stop_codon:yes gene_type:complete
MERSININRVLVTGASGQLGLSLQDIALEYMLLEFVFVDSKTLDITDFEKVKRTFETGHFKYCINSAAYTDVEQAEKSPEIAFKVNAEAVKNLALTCARNGTTLIYISTDYVFDGEKGLPYTVDDKPNPINKYGKSKLEGEKYVREIMDEYYIVRTSWLYHKNHGKNFYKTIMQKAQNGEELRITDEQVGCPTNAANLAKYVIDLISLGNMPYGTYHFTDGQAMSWFDFAKIIVEENGLMNSTTIVKDNNYRSFANRPKYSVLQSL